MPPQRKPASRSANGLAAFAHVVDFGFQLGIGQAADDRLFPDNPGRRSVEPQLIGQRRHFLQSSLRFRARHVLFDARHVGPDLLRRRQRLLLADMAAGRKQLAMEVPEFLAVELHPRGGRDLRRLHRVRPKDREILKHDAQLGIAFDQLGDGIERLFAVAAIVVEEFDQRDLAFGIADDDLMLRVEDLALDRFDRGLALLGFLGLLALVGIAGALVAPIAGGFADRRGPTVVVSAGAGLVLLAFVIFGLWQGSITGLVVGILILDLAVQSSQVANQTRVYALDPTASSRFNTPVLLDSSVSNTALT